MQSKLYFFFKSWVGESKQKRVGEPVGLEMEVVAV